MMNRRRMLLTAFGSLSIAVILYGVTKYGSIAEKTNREKCMSLVEQLKKRTEEGSRRYNIEKIFANDPCYCRSLDEMERWGLKFDNLNQAYEFVTDYCRRY